MKVAVVTLGLHSQKGAQTFTHVELTFDANGLTVKEDDTGAYNFFPYSNIIVVIYREKL